MNAGLAQLARHTAIQMSQAGLSRTSPPVWPEEDYRFRWLNNTWNTFERTTSFPP